MAKKIENRITYVRGTEANNKAQIEDLVKESTKIYVHEQTVYEDGTQSIKLTIHIPKKDGE